MPGSIVPCRHCQHPVSKDAQQCPACGVARPAQAWWARGLAELTKTSTLAAIAALYMLVKCSMPAPPPTAEQRAQTARDDAACRQDVKCWGDRHRTAATLACMPAIERLALYTVRWPEGWFNHPLPHVEWRDRSRGALLYAGRADFQNGVGAWIPVTVACLYDPEINAVLNVEVRPDH